MKKNMLHCNMRLYWTHNFFGSAARNYSYSSPSWHIHWAYRVSQKRSEWRTLNCSTWIMCLFQSQLLWLKSYDWEVFSCMPIFDVERWLCLFTYEICGFARLSVLLLQKGAQDAGRAKATNPTSLKVTNYT